MAATAKRCYRLIVVFDGLQPAAIPPLPTVAVPNKTALYGSPSSERFLQLRGLSPKKGTAGVGANVTDSDAHPPGRRDAVVLVSSSRSGNTRRVVVRLRDVSDVEGLPLLPCGKNSIMPRLADIVSVVTSTATKRITVCPSAVGGEMTFGEQSSAELDLSRADACLQLSTLPNPVFAWQQLLATRQPAVLDCYFVDDLSSSVPHSLPRTSAQSSGGPRNAFRRFSAVGGHSGIWLQPLVCAKSIRKACYVREAAFYFHLFSSTPGFSVLPEQNRVDIQRAMEGFWPSHSTPSDAATDQTEAVARGTDSSSSVQRTSGEQFFDFLRRCVPRCAAIGQLQPSETGGGRMGSVADPKLCHFVELENLTQGLEQPLAMDLSIGTVLYEEGACESKRRKMIAKAESTTAGRFGLRFTGMKGTNWRGEKVEINRLYGRSAKDLRDVLRGLEQFFLAAHPSVRALLVEQVLREVERLRDAWLRQTVCRFCGSSLLVVFDTAARLPPLGHAQSGDGRLLRAATALVKLIDFGHVQRHDADGENLQHNGFRLGLESLVSLLRELSNSRRMGGDTSAVELACVTPE